MILRRLTEAIHRQDWFAVFLEFVIVIAGVVVGFQITAWSADSEARANRMLTLNLLQDEMIENLTVIEARMAYYEGRIARNAIMAEAVTTGELDLQNEADFERAIAQIQFFAPIGIRNAAFDALEQSGDIAVLDDPELLIDLNGYRSLTNWIDAQHTNFRAGISQLGVHIRPHVEHLRNERPGVTNTRWDLDAMHNDLMARSAVIEIERMYEIFAGYSVALHDSISDVCEELATRTGRTCQTGEESQPNN